MIRIATQAGADRYLVGRSIVAVATRLTTDTSGRPALHIAEIVLDDSSTIVLSTAELDGEYATTATRHAGRRTT